jgi:ABC-type nitrate/sulfonate/bicarbonate transport system permease component
VLILAPWLILGLGWCAIALSGLVNASPMPTPHQAAARFWELLA